MTKIKYLHLSDLHIGDSVQKGLISQTKKVLFEDIEYILPKLETLDLVFFTGDLVQKGTKDEFLLLDEFLANLWELFSSHGQNPYLLCVPGNHDLERINDINDPTQKVMTNWLNENIKENYFWGSPNPYHDFVVERFNNYVEWYKKTSIRKPESINWGYLPGDFYCSLNLQDIKLGVVGLNSSFLQLYSGDTRQKLGVYNKQLNFLFNDTYFEWLKTQNLSVLLTHHSPEWFEPNSLSEFNQEIYCNDSYVEHLCGHMHEPLYTTTSINGFPSKRKFISPSLFGLEYYGDKLNSQRIHGYTAGIYNIESEIISKTIWPRISIQTKSGTLKISQNEEFNLDKDSSSLTDVLKDSRVTTSNKFSEDEVKTIKNIEEKSGNLFAKKSIQSERLARTQYKEISTHRNIRLQAQNLAVNILKNQNNLWIVTKFGLGEDEFIGSILNDSGINHANCFCLNCDEVTNIEELTLAFNSSFSLNITQFFDIINTLRDPLVVFNHLNEELIKNTASIKEFTQTILDFCPNSKTIIISETPPDKQSFEYVELTPLDVPGVKQFIEKSQELQSSFTFLEYEKIHRISSGIPLYINKVIEHLKFRPLSDLGDMEFENSSDDVNKALPKTVLNEINLLRADDSKQGNRRFYLMEVLSLLHNGETYERIRRYDPTLPFHPEDISYLLKSKLIETVQVNSIFDHTQTDSELVKIIRVPRVIRDYISSLMDDDEKVEIYKQACSLYLGNNWRSSIKFIQPKDTELDLIIHQNIQVAIRFILSFSIDKNNEIEATRMTRISMSIIKYFSDRGAYKDAVSLTEEILLLIKDVNFEDFDSTRTHLMKKLGENLRMTAIHDRSIAILKSICDDEKNSLSIKDRNSIRLSIAYAYETKNDKSEAVKYANLLKRNEKNKNSELYLSAESVIAHFIDDDSEKIVKLNTIKNKAEKFGFKTLKANVILEICKNVKEESQIKQLDKIIAESKNNTYNKVRALVVKADIILNNKSVNEITNEDLIGLSISYSYSFYQRLQSLLNKCHSLAWQYWSKQNRFDQLLNIFRYSSFVWRLCGTVEKELKYIDELHSNPEFIEWFKSNKHGINSTYYEQRIFALYNNGTRNRVLE